MTDAGLMPPPLAKDSSSKSKGNENGYTELVLPLSRIKKIAKLDPEVRGITKEAMPIMVLAAEMFIKKLGQETNRIAQIQNRRTLLPEDVVEVCSAREAFAFLREDVRDLHREQVEQKKNNRKAAAEAKMKLAVEERTASRPIDSFFKGPPKSS
uniref:Transcription factor CBF/NF-Y/archaeal histone domain-containing protein n=1 Tax=Leptocylindrus danicus TaxID=163516 RepID=A0A6U2NTT2_9STRA|mmetsp:Transcript_22588/g.33855  ORF Transcript_22588/g.33855 Transcript_22588/m.33855 type:complete len:154 (+) Transcript_22588:327-788(+)